MSNYICIIYSICMSPVMFQDLKFQIDDFFMIKWPQQRGLGEKTGLLDASAFQNDSCSEKLKSRSGSILGHPTHTTGKKQIEPHHEKTCLLSYANKKYVDQAAHPHSLISTFVVRYLHSIIPLPEASKISRPQLVSAAEQLVASP